MAVVSRWTDYRGRVVELTDQRWKRIVDGHPEMADRIDDIGATIAGPSLVVRDPDIRRLEHYYGASAGSLHLHVPVIYRPTPEGWIGTVWTAHRTDRVKRGEQLWP